MMGSGLRAKIILLFTLILIVPVGLLMFFAISRTEQAARQDFNRRLGYAANLLRKSLGEQYELTVLDREKVFAGGWDRPAAAAE